MSGVLARVLTIGIQGFDSTSFIAALQRADADVVVDIRARRGLRGSTFAWGNSRRLQDLLRVHGVGYVHMPQFAPSEWIRDLQHSTDASSGTLKRDRVRLGNGFMREYRREILREDAAQRFLAAIPTALRSPALLCVERLPSACHRSLLAERLGADLGVPIEDLVP